MKAIVITADQKLELGEAPAPDLRAGEVRIRVRASGVNRADMLQRKGHYPSPAGESPLAGLEVAGEVIECAPDAKRFAKGTRVMALLAGGGYAEEACAPETQCLAVPERFSFEEAAAIPEVFLTAHHNLFTLGGAARGKRALIHAGASGVGTAGIQLLKIAGVETWVTVGSEDKAARCRELGAKTILYRTENFADAIKAQTDGKGVDVILDPIGGSYFADNLRSLGLDGRLVNIGLMGGTKAEIDLREMLNRRLQVIASTLRNLSHARKAAIVEKFTADFLPRFADGTLKPIIDQVFATTDAMRAHERMEDNHNIGKIILSWK